MLWWFAQTTLIAAGLVVVATLAGRWKRLGPEARHALWLVVLIKFVTPPVVAWPWAVPESWHDRPVPVPAPVTVAVVEPSPPAVTVAVDSPSPAPALPVEAPEPIPAERSTPDILPEPETPPIPEAPTEPMDVPALPISGMTDPEPADPDPETFAPQIAAPAPDSPLPVPVPPPLKSEIENPKSSVLAPAPAPAPREEIPNRTSEIWNPRSAILALWLAGSVVVVVRRMIKVVRFRRSLAGARPAPAWLVEETRAIGERIGVRPPPVLATPGVGTPLLWCLGRPVLILPEALIDRLENDRWAGILAHELAHLGRRDHWVVRLELLAEAVWWWNPLFRLARVRLHEESERACDAWVVRSLPERRFAYAEALVDVCEHLARTAIPSPALGVGGAGASRSLEGRLLMILRDPIPHRPSRRAALAIALLAALTLPTWTLGQQQPDATKADTPKPDAPRPPNAPVPPPALAAKDDARKDEKEGSAANLTLDGIRRGYVERRNAVDTLAMRSVATSRTVSAARGDRQVRVQVADVLLNLEPIVLRGEIGQVFGNNAPRAISAEPGGSRLDVIEARPEPPPPGAVNSDAFVWMRRLEVRTISDVKTLRVASTWQEPVPFRWRAIDPQQEQSRQQSTYSLNSIASGETLLATDGKDERTDLALSPSDRRPLIALGLDGPILSILNPSQAQASVAGSEVIDGHPTVRIAWIDRQVLGTRGLCWLAPDLGFAVVRSEAVVILGDPRNGQSHQRSTWRKNASDFVNEGDFWLPRKVVIRQAQVEASGQTTSEREEVVTFENYRINRMGGDDSIDRIKFPIQTLDEKTGEFTTTPPPPAPGLVDRLKKAVAESPFGPPGTTKTPENPAPAAAFSADLGSLGSLQNRRAALVEELKRVEARRDLAKAVVARNEVLLKKDPKLVSNEEFAKSSAEFQVAENEVTAKRDELDEATKLLDQAKRRLEPAPASDPAPKAETPAPIRPGGLTQDDVKAKAAKAPTDRPSVNTPSHVFSRDDLEILQARRDGKAAEVQKATVQRELAEAVILRNQALLKKDSKLVSREDMQKSEADFVVADAEVAIKKAELDEATAILNQGKRRLGIAPVAGPAPAPFADPPDSKATRLVQEVVELASEMKAAKAKFDAVRRIVRTQDDPAVKAAQNKMDMLQSRYNELSATRGQAIRDRMAERALLGHDDLALMQARRDGKAAEVRKAEAQRDLADQSWKRGQALLTRNAIGQQEYDQAAADFKVAEADVAIKKAELDEADLLLNLAKRRLGGAAVSNPETTPAPASSPAGLRDAVELMEVQLQGKQAELRGVEVKFNLAQRLLDARKPLHADGRITQMVWLETESGLQTAQAELDGKKAEVLEAEVRLKQAKRRVEAVTVANPETTPAPASSPAGLRDAVELAEVQLQGKQAELLGAEAKVRFAQMERGTSQEPGAASKVGMARSEVEQKKVEVLEFEVRLKQAKRRLEAAIASTPEASPASPASASSLTGLRDAVELIEVQLQGKQAELRQVDAKRDVARRKSERIKGLADRGAVEVRLADEAGDHLRAAEAEIEAKKAEVLEFGVRLNQAKRRVEVEEARLKRESDRAKVELDRVTELVKKGFVGRSEFANARARYDELMFQIDPKHVATPDLPDKPNTPPAPAQP